MEATCEIFNDDCIAGMAERLAPESVHLTVTSIPFEGLFTYSGKVEDVGNSESTVDLRAGRFALNLRFVIEQLFRVHAPGSVCCVHVQQLIAYRNTHGYMGRRDFRGAVIDLFRAGGFHPVGEAAIGKDPQALAQRSKLLSLQFKTGHSRSSTSWAPAPNDYVLVFQKPGEPAVPVRPLVYHPSKRPTARREFFAQLGRADDAAYTDYLRDWAETTRGAINPGGWLSADDWIEWACGVWEVNEFDVLDGAAGAKEHDQEKHVCPLQLEVYRRCLLLYSNPAAVQADVLVMDPFAGIGSGAWAALGAPSPLTKLAVPEPRNFVGFELKDSYHRTAVRNAERARKVAGRRQRETDLFALEAV